jgi:hypothetical protein
VGPHDFFPFVPIYFLPSKINAGKNLIILFIYWMAHSYDILGARMLWQGAKWRILKNFNVQNEECHNYGMALCNMKIRI